MKQLTELQIELQKEFIKLLEERFQVEPIQINIDEDSMPIFESLFDVENKLTDIKEENGFQDTRDGKEAIPL